MLRNSNECPFQLIGISGKIGSGKTTLSQYLQNYYPRLQKVSFAENLRKVVSILTGIPIEKTRSAKDKEVYLSEWGKTVGELLQLIGTEGIRSVNSKAWVISLFSTYNPFIDCWIIDDVRFVEEADYIKKMGGKLIRLEGDPGNILSSCTRDLTHGSEMSLDDYDDFDLKINTNNYVGKLDEMHNLILSIK